MAGTCGASAFGQAYWRFEAGSGTTVVDSGPYGMDGELSALPLRTADTALGAVPLTGETNGQSLDLGWEDAVTAGFITVPDPELVLAMGGADITFEAWVKLESLSDTSDASQRQVLLQKKLEESADDTLDYMVMAQRGTLDPEPNYGKASGYSGRELQLVFGGTDRVWGITSNLEITDNEWHFISVAVDAAGNKVRFGIDTTFETITYEENQRVVHAGPLRVGSHWTAQGANNHFLRGAIDELRITRGFLPQDELLNATMPDCNNNQVWDRLDIASMRSSDCNANARPDECDIGDGGSADCQSDGIPDECQLANRVELAHHRTTGELAWRADFPYMAWLSRFDVAGGAGILESFEIDLGIMAPGTDVDVFVWGDPNGDGHPSDGQVLWTDSVTTRPGQGSIVVDVPSIDVGSTGAKFFVGAVLPDAIGDPNFPAQFDIAGSPPPGRSWGVGADAPIDPNNLAANAGQIGPLEELLFAGNWVITAHTTAPGNDCDADNIPDDCQLADLSATDQDCSGLLDLCEDCNGNGVLDGIDLAGGTSFDDNADGIPDSCQLAYNDCNGDGVPDDVQLDATTDCNGNLVLDACDVAQGTSPDVDNSSIPDECEDCNGNGVLDSADIAATESDDCNADGVPDECQLGEPFDTVDYIYDDGTRESQIAFTPPILEVAWMHRYVVQPGGEWVAAIEIVWGETYPGLPAKVVLWSDPNGDGDPSDARVLREVVIVTDNVDEMVWNTVQIPPTEVGAAGTSFFVGGYFDDVYGTKAVALDVTNSAGESWVAISNDPDTMDLNNLAPGTESSGLIHFGAMNFLVRAVGFDGRSSNDCDGDASLDECGTASCPD